MTIDVADAIKTDQSLITMVNLANQRLQDIIGPASGLVNISWNFKRDAKDRPKVELVLSDFTGARASTEFAPDEVINQRILYARLYRIWGDLLQVRSHKQFEQLSGRMQTGE